MLTRQSVIAETSCVETVPIDLVTTEDGRTLLAVTEHEDVMLEILAAPITIITQNGTSATLDVKNLNGNFLLQPPVFQINMEDVGAGFQQPTVLPTRILETTPVILEQPQSQDNNEPDYESPVVSSLPPLATSNDVSVDKKKGTTREKKPTSKVSKNTIHRKSPGRPKKNDSPLFQGGGKLKCDVCQQEFDKQNLYRKHMENHAEEKPHRCPKCPASFNIPTNFTLHMATHNTGEPKCPECGRKFARMASLKSHMLLHEKEENLFCAECEDAFSTKAQLDAHLKLHGEKWSNEEARKCKLCNKQFVQPALYRLHIREHYRLQTKIVRQTKRGAKHKTMYKCTICLKSFQKPSQLMRHIRVHTGEKPFKCTVCGRAFTQKSSLQIHTWQHNGIRPHSCDFCNAKFSQKGNLNAHVLRVHNAPEGEPIYGCTYCSCIFKKLGSLNSHIKRMHSVDSLEESVIDRENHQADGDVSTEDDMRATVDSVMSQLASLESNGNESRNSTKPASEVNSATAARKDILQQALKNSGLPNGLETKRLEARTSFVTLLDRAPDGGTRKYVKIRQRCVGNVRWYACTFCHKEFKKPSDLIRHFRVHTQEKPFKCAYCYRSFALKSTMIAHERTHTGAKKYACGSCERTFACHGSLSTHAKLHAKPDNCNNQSTGSGNTNEISIASNNDNPTAAKSQLKSHSRGKSKLSPEAESLVPQVVLQEPLVISDTGNRICVAQVASKQKGAYTDTTDAARPHKCWVCHAAFRKISHLKQHYRRHTGERPFKCTKCDRRFTSNSVLKSHLHTHEDSRPYSCSVCSTKFSTQSSMKRHLVTHSNKRPFMCPYCHKTFKTYVNCRKHMKIHRHELAQRQLEQQKQNVTQNQTGNNSVDTAKGRLSCFSSSSSSAVDTSNTLTENLALPRIETIEMTFQPQIDTDYAQVFSEQLPKDLIEEKEKSVTAAIVDQNLSGVANLGASQMLHADETGTVTLPGYSGDQALTPESIREIEETLNQQLFNIGVNLELGSNLSRQIDGTNVLDSPTEDRQQDQQDSRQPPILNVIYENKSIDSSGNVFTSQFDSFDMTQIALQPDSEIDIGLDTTNSANMASILPRSTKEEQRMCIPVTTVPNVTDNHPGKVSMQTVVLISKQAPNFAKVLRKSDGRDEVSEIRKTNVDPSERPHEVSTMFLAEEYQNTANRMNVSPEIHVATSGEIEDTEAVDSMILRQESLLQCHMCNEQGFTTTGLKEHLKSHRWTKDYRCSECPLRFCTNGGLTRHLKTHANKQEWKCVLCDKIFNSKTQLRSHSKIHMQQAGWNVTSRDTNNLQQVPILTDDASIAIGAASQLNDVEIDTDSTVSERVLLATVAEKAVMERADSMPERKEQKEYTNKCRYCPKTFRKPSDLIRHTRTHTGERPYKCDYCSKSFAVKCTLDSHMKVHIGKKTFRCHVCNSLFATKGSLKVHMRLHTGSKPFRCPVCELRFRTSGHRKVHMLKHAREYKAGPKRKQKHMKVAAVAEVVADLERSNVNTEKIIPIPTSTTTASTTTTTTFEQHQAVSQNIATYPHLEAIGLTGQITFDTDSAISTGNQILSVNESNQLVANLQFFLANGLVTIQTDEPVFAQPTTEDRPSIDTNDSMNACPVLEAVVTNANMHNENQEVVGDAEVMGQISTVEVLPLSQLPVTDACLLSNVSSTRVEPRTVKSERVVDKTATKGNPSKKECDICGKTFMKPYQVERHKRIHTGERPYKCDLCAKSFAQKATLQMHQKHHTGDRPHPCPHCEYSFTQKGNLRTHVKRVHQLDTLDIKKLRRSRQSLTPKLPQESSLTEAKIFSLDDISFVEFLK